MLSSSLGLQYLEQYQLQVMLWDLQRDNPESFFLVPFHHWYYVTIIAICNKMIIFFSKSFTSFCIFKIFSSALIIEQVLLIFFLQELGRVLGMKILKVSPLLSEKGHSYKSDLLASIISWLQINWPFELKSLHP